MKQCLLCNQFFTPPVLFTQIFRLKKYRERKLCSYCLKQFEHLIGNKCAFCSKVLKQGAICVDCKNWQKNIQIIFYIIMLCITIIQLFMI